MELDGKATVTSGAGHGQVNADEVRHGWANRVAEYSPDYYAYYGPNETSELLRETFDRVVDTDASVFELGCSAGRHLKHLHDHGFTNLHGVDINGDSFEVMRSEYPALVDAGTFSHDAIEAAVRGFDDGQFAAVFSVETLQHIHADDEWVFEEIARITDDVLVTVECEEPVRGDPSGASVNYVNGDFPLYYRDWERIFTEVGLRQVAVHSVGGDTMRVFRRE